MKIRQPSDDKLKSLSKLREQAEQGLRCSLEDCEKPLTSYKGPGDKLYCREHQLMQTEYGGLGKRDRPHTFARDWCCAWCEYDPREDSRFDNFEWESEADKIRAMRSTLIGDHTQRKVEGGSDGKDNVQTLCVICDRIKTMYHKDYQKLQTKFVVE